MATPVLVRKLKYDGSVKSLWEGELVENSAEINWLTVHHHPKKHRKYKPDGTPLQADRLLIHFFNIAHPITVLMNFDENHQFAGAKCDAALPAKHNGDLIEFIDLDLDVVVNQDLSYYVQDEAEFEQHRVSMNYSEATVRQAHTGIALAKTLLKQRLFPFDQHKIRTR